MQAEILPQSDSNSIERVPWDEFLERFVWRQGEHVTILGPTGGGKTTIELAILHKQPWVVFFGTKGRDDTLDKLISEEGYRRIYRWHDRSPIDNRVILWPKSRKLSSALVQRTVFEQALIEIYEAGAWCCVFDEVLEFTKDLKMPNIIQRYWRQGRSNRLSVVAGSQRPVDIPVLAYSSATHLFLQNTNDMRDVKRFAEISGFVDRRAIQRTVQELPHHDALYINTRTGEMLITNTQNLKGGEYAYSR